METNKTNKAPKVTNKQKIAGWINTGREAIRNYFLPDTLDVTELGKYMTTLKNKGKLLEKKRDIIDSDQYNKKRKMILQEKRQFLKEARKVEDTNISLQKDIGTVIRNRRKELNITQSEMSKTLGICISSVYRIEHGRPSRTLFNVLNDLENIMKLKVELNFKKVK